ncbi:MAG: CHAD domain-containing protein, partial [Acetobacteraceae bacterium]
MNVSTAIALPGPPTAPKLWPGLSTPEGFARMVRSGLGDIEPLLGPPAGMEIEAVHDLRICVRRIRAPLALFAPVLAPAAGRFDHRLRAMGRLLGAVRDWQVLRTETLARAHGLAENRVAV